MAVLIEGVEIPKDKAVSLILCSSGDVYYDNLKIAGKAIEVPEPHGRLCDLDALPWYLANTSVKYATYEDWEMLCDAIAAAPTVIPASKEAE